MSTKYNVRVRPDYRYPRVRVSGRDFSKQGQVFTSMYLNDEIRNSPLLEVELIPEGAVAPLAKPKRVSKSKSRLSAAVEEDV